MNSAIPDILAIDFDGTIVEDKYPEIGELKPDAVEVINRLKKDYFLILNTCRTGEKLKEAVDFLKANGIEFDLVNENHPALIDQYGDTRKIFATYYIDDRSLIGGSGNWDLVDTYLSV